MFFGKAKDRIRRFRSPRLVTGANRASLFGCCQTLVLRAMALTADVRHRKMKWRRPSRLETYVYLPLPQLTTCMLILHLAMGCCWHHIHSPSDPCCREHGHEHALEHGPTEALEHSVAVAENARTGDVCGEATAASHDVHRHTHFRAPSTAVSVSCCQEPQAQTVELNWAAKNVASNQVCQRRLGCQHEANPQDETCPESHHCSGETCQYVSTEPFSWEKTEPRAWACDVSSLAEYSSLLRHGRTTDPTSEVLSSRDDGPLRRHLLCSVLLI